MAHNNDSDKRLRTAARKSVTKAINTAKNYMEEQDDHGNDIRGLTSLIRTKLNVLDELDPKILISCDDEDVDKEMSESDTYQTNIYTALAAMEKYLENLHPASSSHSSPQNSTTGRPNSPNHLRLQLPKLNIPTFDGNPLNYQTFIDCFESSINSNERLNDVDKFLYLKGLLKGKALNTIEGLSITEGNYAEALELLKTRFGDEKLLIATYFDALLNLKPVTDSTKVSRLRDLYDAIESNVRNLKSLGITSESFGPVVIPTILNKIPESIRIEVAKVTRAREWEFESVLKCIHDELLAREQCEFVGKPTTGDRQPRGGNILTGSSLHSSEISPRNRCVYCGDAHKPWECNKVTDITKRRELLRKDNRCYNCLRKSHNSRECNSKYSCYHCKEKHNSSLCERNKRENQSIHSNVSCERKGNNEIVFLKTAIATVTCTAVSETNGEIKARILFDDCSQRSYIKRELCEKLKLNVLNTRNVIIKGVCANSTVTKSEVVELYLKTTSGHALKITANVLEEICSPITQQPIQSTVKEYPHLKGLKFADYHQDSADLKIDILLGADYYYQVVTDVVRRGGPNSPVAVHSKFGWLLGGPVISDGITVHTNISEIYTMKCSECEIVDPNEREKLSATVNKFWDLETIGIKKVENSVVDSFLDSIKYDEIEAAYEVSLPWKPNQHLLPDNYSNALRRLSATFNRLKRNPKVLCEYHEVISDQLENEVIEKCKDTDILGKLHYLPHREVMRDDKISTKLRVVYDCSSKKSKDLSSLNDCLYKGPSLSQMMFDVLLRFRLHETAFICDLKKAFLQIRVNEIDRNYLRFLWFKDPFLENPEIVVYRFTRVLFGMNCSPFLLNATLRHHLEKFSRQNSESISRILRSLYVDDFAGGCSDASKAYELFSILKEILSQGGFAVHKFVTNNPALESLVNGTSEKRETEENDVIKVLGIPWCPKADTITIELQQGSPMIEDAPTKRQILSAIAQIFDPLGLISPVILAAKIILQEAWKQNSNWDEPLNEDIGTLWKSWTRGFQQAANYTVPRYYGLRDAVNYKLVGFCDASTKAYAAVVYLRAESTLKAVSSTLVASKSRVSPINNSHTIPRLELIACHMLCTLMESVEIALNTDIKIIEKQYWTDSTINLFRIRGLNSEYKQFVENRLKYIRRKSNIENWYYVPTEFNPADLPSRGCLPNELKDYDFWQYGPKFLNEYEFDKMKFEMEIHQNQINTDLELKGENSKVNSEILNSFQTQETVVNPYSVVNDLHHVYLHRIIDISRFSSMDKLLRVTAYLLRFTSKGKVNQDSEALSVEELETARTKWIQSEQLLQKSDKEKEFLKIVNNFSLYVENGILRCRGRISKSDLPYDAKHPIYIPRDTKLAELIVKEAHDNVYHQKEKSTLTEVRSNYWIPRGRKLVRQIVRKCQLCKRLEGTPFSLPKAPELPEYRVEIAPPYTNVGFDHMGPLWVKDIYDKKSLHKVYVALFTCCSTRMIHLELQPRLESEYCKRAMRRTFSRVGTPRRVVTDNHKTFRSESLRTFARQLSIDWKYILELSPHWGGFYERLNGLVKRILRKIVWRSKLTYEELETILTEIEGTLNSRPLCYVYDYDISEPLTPSHLMFGRRLSNKNIGFAELTEEVHPVKRVMYIKKLLGHFFKRFKEEYLTELRERERGAKNATKPIQIGDVVLINEKGSPRITWPLGRVERLISSADGNVRGAVLKTESGELKRPINLLYFLEMSDLGENVEETRTEEELPKRGSRNRRMAAKMGEQIRKALTMD